MRAVFFGTPAIAVPALKALVEVARVVAVVCQPDRPAGRGLKLHAPEVKLAALELGLPVHQPTKVKTGLAEWLAEQNVDVAVVMAYGRILTAATLAATRRGCMNLHASLLPKYRGAAPINWAIVHGETETGVSLMQMDEGLDTGPIYCERHTAIRADETAGELAERLGLLSAEIVRGDLPRAVSGELTAVPQQHEFATYAPLIDREHTRIDWTRGVGEIVNLVRGMAPRPCAHTGLRGKLLHVTAARACNVTTGKPLGTVSIDRGRILVSAQGGSVEILRAKLEGRKELAAPDLINGRAIGAEDLLAE